MYTNLCVCVPVAICVGVHMLTGISTRIPGLTTYAMSMLSTLTLRRVS